ncbi:GNAT family N-acetyltransferase [Roseomonas sp. BN140053]|uniref:GNAT family N-acetyltransferase n=1 Tax=Roseomonas sp. BN140053 TaxID=3391898 RepID=UPI0039E7FFE7
MTAIRRATEADAPALVELVRQLGRQVTEAEVLATLREGDSHPVLVAEEAGQVLGVVAVHATRMLHRLRPDARITTLVVAEGARGRGLGRQLVDAAALLAERSGCNRLELTTGRDRREAQAFYRALGFTDSSIRFHRMLGPDQP